MFISQLGKPMCWKFPTAHENTSCKCVSLAPRASRKQKAVHRLNIPLGFRFLFTSAQTPGTLTFPQAVNVFSVMLEQLYEIHRPQTTSERRDIDSPIRAERATWITSLMRYEVDSRRGGGRLLSLPSSFLPLPGVLQITSPDPGVLASDWPQQAYLPNKPCLIGPQETMACVNSPGALDSRPTQQSLC